MFKTKQHIQRRPKAPVEGLFCNYSHRICMQNRLEGFDYCIKHILEDKDAPYKQCNYMSNKNGKRCHTAAPKADRKDGYCTEHARKAMLMRQHAARKHKPRETPETLLEDLEHHSATSAHVRPRPRPSMESTASRILDYASSSDSEDGAVALVDQAWRGDGDSDAESIDSEQEDPLKHAGVYTAEEVALITRDKLIRLQSLYIDQFKRLQHVMRERRRKYLRGIRIEKDRLSSIHAAKDDPEQKGQYDRLMALKKYHKRHGREALLHRQSKERRIAASEGANYKHPAYSKCIHVTDGVKCLDRVVPLAKFCQQHILEDVHQVLFQPCDHGQGTCGKPVALCGQEAPRCMLHVPLYEYTSRLPIKDEEPVDMMEDVKDMMLQQIDVVSEDSKPLFDETDDQPLAQLLNLDKQGLMRPHRIVSLPEMPTSGSMHSNMVSPPQTLERQISH